jgi:hypothetical protein
MTDTASFDLLRKRLASAATGIRAKTDALNQQRLALFGRVEPKLTARLNARTEHNSIARDVVRVHDTLLFGYQVLIGLKRETQIADVFCLYQLNTTSEPPELDPVAIDQSFLSDQRFVADFKELVTYYKSTSLEQLRVVQDKLLMLFRTGSKPGDRRVFRFVIENSGKVNYIDARGDRDHVLPPPFDFEWTPVTRELHVLGRHPHVNIADSVFVETIGGDLTVKIENNTESGLGIFSEAVEDKTQALADAEMAYADLRHQILIRVKPYRESTTRFLIFNKRMKTVVRCDEIGISCVQLPEDHGIVFPGGYALESGEMKRFADIGLNFDGFKLKRTIKAPNGEDVLYVFYEETSGRYGLLPYNLIDRAIGQPLMAHGYARYADGRILLFVPETGEASRLHAMQLWRTPFADMEFASEQKTAPGLFGRLGNASLVRALADLRQLTQLAEDARVIGQFDSLYKLSNKCAEAYLWLAEAEAQHLLPDIQQLAKTARSALEAFEQVEKAKSKAASDVAAMGKSVRELLGVTASRLWQKPDDFTTSIVSLKRKRGELTSLGEQAHVLAADIAALDQSLSEELARVGNRALKFFAEPSSFQPLKDALVAASRALAKADGTSPLKAIETDLNQQSESLDGLTELISSFEGSDPQQRADLLSTTSQLFGELNQLRASLKQKRDSLMVREQGAEFSAQLKALEQSQTSTLARATTPEALDEALAKVLSQLEQLDTRFADQPQFSNELITRRESTLEAFSAKREQLSQERDRRAQALKDAIQRVITGLPRRVAKLSSADEVHAFFASDSLLERARSQIEDLRKLARIVDADELSGKLRSLRESSLRDVRDRLELSQDGHTLKLGKHRFSIASRQIDLSLVRDQQQFFLTLTGTDYRQPIDSATLQGFEPVWNQLLPSEDEHVYRAEYLTYQLHLALNRQSSALTLNDVERTAIEQALNQADPMIALPAAIALVCERLPMEGYQRGVHDQDTARLWLALRNLDRNAGTLRTSAQARVLAQAWFASLRMEAAHEVQHAARALFWLQKSQSEAPQAVEQLPQSWLAALRDLAKAMQFDVYLAEAAAQHLIDALGNAEHFPAFGAALDLAARLENSLPKAILSGLKESRASVAERLTLWQNLLHSQTQDSTAAIILEAAAICAIAVHRERVNVELSQNVSELLGEHGRIQSGSIKLDLPEFLDRLSKFAAHKAPMFRAFTHFKHELLEKERDRLRLGDLAAKPLAGFVRNRLIDEVYLPLIGNNLAKQIGTLDDKRSDRSGMLLLISPPGYGKTTLMEYLADRLGLIFVRINGPTFGHETSSLDPAQAKHRGAEEELTRLNLGLAMGNNVMLYLDDIQHLGAEFLQKFISLSDGTRRIDAIIDGKAQTLDLRGKRFALVMAGNPYTESGEVFRIPDMLANRADVYNLGDVLSGREALFADSYLENCLSANPITASLGTLDHKDKLACIRIASGQEATLPNDVSLESIEVLKRMVATRNVLSKVNAAYVASAAQDDAFRTEPPFKLQGSYRNMVKLTAQLSALMTDRELDQLIRDHYRGEAQTLGARAEENLLKLAMLIGQASDEENARWENLVENFRVIQKQGGKNSDGSTKIASLLADIAVQLESQLRQAGQSSQSALDQSKAQTKTIAAALAALQQPTSSPTSAQLVAPPELSQAFKALVKTYEETLLPLVSAMHHKTTLDHAIWEQVRQVRTDMDELVKKDRRKKPGF